MSAQDALNAARARIGYYAPDDPNPGSEAGRWMAGRTGQSWLSGPSTSVWWCMCFVSMCVELGGGRLPGGPQFNTDTAASMARREGRLVDKSAAVPGDVAIFDWNWNSAATDHTGLIEENHSGWFTTVEGNTSSGTGGSQSAGNGVWRRQRSWDDVRYVIRPYWDGQATAQPAPAVTVKRTTDTDQQLIIDQDGIPGAATNSRLQQVMGTPIDGVIDTPSPAAQQLQRFLNTVVSQKDIQALTGDPQLDVDGYLGEKTWKVFQYWFANVRPTDMKNICGFNIQTNTARFWSDWCDGIDGVWTWTALQFALNHSYANSGKLFSK